jgi:hypothetical protein
MAQRITLGSRKGEAAPARGREPRAPLTTQQRPHKRMTQLERQLGLILENLRLG